MTKEELFPQFCRLPPELQAYIWNIVLSEPHICQLCFRVFEVQNIELWDRAVPPLLQACAESRRLALSVYPDKLYEQKNTDLMTYARPELDTIYIGSANDGVPFEWVVEEFSLKYVPTMDMSRIKHLALDIDYWELNSARETLRFLPSFDSLETLTLVIEDDTSTKEAPRFVQLDQETDMERIGRSWPGSWPKDEQKLLHEIRAVFEDMKSQGEFEEEDLEWTLPELRVRKLVGVIKGRKA
ncbi:hypothetical protein EDB80DRAFT_739528 [Ilyonectria destructans]|nr:hypothetical protein EDB80DRAFT_739528 [Ilyonectria destructans]